MKKIGFFENSYFLDIVVKLSQSHPLAEAIKEKFDIYAEGFCDTTKVHKSAIIEKSDIEAIKKFAEEWITDDKTKEEYSKTICGACLQD